MRRSLCNNAWVPRPGGITHYLPHANLLTMGVTPLVLHLDSMGPADNKRGSTKKTGRRNAFPIPPPKKNQIIETLGTVRKLETLGLGSHKSGAKREPCSASTRSDKECSTTLDPDPTQIRKQPSPTVRSCYRAV